MRELNVIVNMVIDTAAIITFETVHYPDERVLLGYVLHYVATKDRNVKMYEGRDGCGADNWKVEDVVKESTGRRVEHLTAFLTPLQPNTLYAFFVKTYTIASEQNGGQTRIHYLKTKPSRPEMVVKLLAEPLADSHSIVSSCFVLWVVSCELF